MASASVQTLSKEDVAAAKALFKGATVTLDASLVKKGQTTTHGLLWNQLRDWNKNLVVYEKHDWVGANVQPYPDPLYHSMHTQPSIFVHQGVRGSKGGVVYVDGKENSDRKWVVAFDGLDDKVYVEAGPIGPTDWNVVEDRLNLSGSESSAVDPVYGGTVIADIRPFEGRSLLSVRFSG